MVRSLVLLALALGVLSVFSPYGIFEDGSFKYYSYGSPFVYVPFGDCSGNELESEPCTTDDCPGEAYVRLSVVGMEAVFSPSGVGSKEGYIRIGIHDYEAPVPSCGLSCDAGTSYSVKCNHHIARVSLSAAGSAKAVGYTWSVPTGQGSFSNPASQTPALTFYPTGNCINQTHTVSLTVVDADGTEAPCTASVTVFDDEAPVFDGLDVHDTTVDCKDVPAAVSVTATDNCANAITVNFKEEKTETGAPNSYYLEREWAAADTCGFTQIERQRLLVEDTTPPTFAGVDPDYTTSNCEIDPPDCDVTAQDDCGPASVQLLGTSTTFVSNDPLCLHRYEIVRTWQATDTAGNVNTTSQTIGVYDTEAPELVGTPADLDITVECGMIPAPPTVYAKDNCGQVQPTFSEWTDPGSCENEYTIFRMWTADDHCGNPFSVTQTIHVEDTEAPNLSGVEAAQTVSAAHADALAACEVVAQDQCDEDVQVYLSTEKIDGDCDLNYTLIHTWEATDDCGNVASETQSIDVTDTSWPQFEAEPSDATFECNQVVNTYVSARHELCGGDLNVSFSENKIPTSCDSEYTLVRDWATEDCCGKTASLDQTVVVIDTLAPMFDASPKFTERECWAPAAFNMTATDLCDTTVDVQFSEERQPGGCTFNFTLVRNWFAEDCSGNSVNHSQTVEVTDTVKPQFLQNPVSLTVLHDNVPDVPSVEAEDNCLEHLVTFTEQKVDVECENNYTLERTWLAVDACGNEAEWVQSIVVRDETPPVITISKDETIHVACHQLDQAETTANASDTGGAVSLVFSESETWAADCLVKIEREWVATDLCGLTSRKTQTIHVTDNEDPELFVETGLTMGCGDDVPTPTHSANDTCSDVSVSIARSASGQLCGLDIPATYEFSVSAVDACGKDASKSSQVIVLDQGAPTLSEYPESTTVTRCTIPDAPTVTATDDCTEEVSVTYSEAGNTPCSKEITRKWTAFDACGKKTVHAQTITVINTLPTAPEPQNRTEVCPWAPAADTLTWTDDCTSTFTEAETRVDPHTHGSVVDTSVQGIVTVTYWAKDACEETEYEQTITIEDQHEPTLIDVPISQTVQCTDISLPTPTAEDTCDDSPDVFESITRTPGDPDCVLESTITYEWVAQDASGDTSSATATVFVTDSTNPFFIGRLPAATASAHCEPAPLDLSAFDNCHGATNVSFTSTDQHYQDADFWTRKYLYTAEDPCGNKEEFIQTVYVEDTESPTISPTGGEDHTSVCASALPPFTATATDNCGDVSVTYEESRTGDCLHQYTVLRRWTATDSAGLTDDAFQTITVFDDVKPIFQNIKPSFTVSRVSLDQVLHTTDHVSASDNCDGALNFTVSYTESPHEPGCDYDVMVEYFTEDDCGNSERATETFHVIDNTPYQLYDLTLTCPDDSIPYAGCTTPTASGKYTKCDVDYPATVSNATVGDSCSRTITFQVLYGASLQKSCPPVTVEDSKDPTATAPASVTSECEAPPVGVPCGSDDCNDLGHDCNDTDTWNPNAYVYLGSDITDTQHVYHRVWNFKDACDNSVNVTQTVTVVDNSPPYFDDVPPSYTGQCASYVPDTRDPSGSDNCAVTTTAAESQITRRCACDFDVIRSWTATDGFGNSNTTTQTITIDDTIPPTFNHGPFPNLTGDYAIRWTSNGAPEYPLTGTLIATDDVDNAEVAIAFSEVITNKDSADDKNYTITRTWYAEDDCGNAASMIQIIEVYDGQGLLDDLNVTCGTDFLHVVVKLDELQVELQSQSQPGDVVSYTVDPSLSPETVAPYACYETWLTVTWTTKNVDLEVVSNFSTTVSVVDIDRPVFTVPHFRQSKVEGCEDPELPAVDADDCDPNMSLTFSETRGPYPKGYMLTRTWHAEDACGLYDDRAQVVYVVDSAPPTLTVGVPDDTTVQCEMPPLENPDATDICSSVVITPSNYSTPTCGEMFFIERTWSIEDGYGNELAGPFTQTIHVVDTEGPQVALGDRPQDTTASCQDVPPVGLLSAIDVCEGAMEVGGQRHRTSETCTEDYVLTDSWGFNDNCDNPYNVSRIVTVSGVAPYFTDLANHTQECSAPLAPPFPSVNDDCSTSLERTHTDGPRTSNVCTEEFVRTWVVEDECSRKGTFEQTITLEDTTAPYFVQLPADQTANCDMPDLPTVTFEDACHTDNIVVTQTATEPTPAGANKYPYTVVRTWNIFDGCQSNEAKQTVTVQDILPPTITFQPADTTVECDLPDLEHVSYSENCDATMSFSESTTGSCPMITERTWVVTDMAGLTASYTQTITVVTPAPTWVNLPQNRSGDECEESPLTPPTAVHGCGADYAAPTPVLSKVWTPVDAPTDQVKGHMVYTWSIDDGCNDPRTHEVSVTVWDTEKPFTCGFDGDLDATVQCLVDVPTPSDLPCNDTCSDCLPVDVTTQETGGECDTTVTHTYFHSDVHGNDCHLTAQVRVKDTTAPAVSVNDVTAECNIPNPTNWLVGDNCGKNVTVSATGVQTTSDVYNEASKVTRVVTREYQGEDPCGNKNATNQTITIYDITDPTLNMASLSDTTISCEDPVPTGHPSYDDTCDPDPALTYATTVVDNGCSQVVTREWVVADHVGNTATDSQTITIVDETAPSILGITDGQASTYECGSTVVPPTVRAETDCGLTAGLTLTTSVSTYPKGEKTVYHYVADDGCNSAEASYEVFIRDIAPPTFNFLPQSTTVDCNDIPTMPTVDATDTCTDVTVVVSEKEEGICNSKTITRTWEATDGYGNVNTHTQIITISDTNAPDFSSSPDDATYECGLSVPQLSVNALDDCDETVSSAEVSREIVRQDGLSTGKMCQFDVIDTYSATDQCGNQRVQVRVINVTDNTKPTLSGIPDDTTAECDEVLPVPTVTATDECADDLVPEMTETIMPGQDCDEEYKVIRVWGVEDACGNPESGSYTISVFDTSPPVFTLFPDSDTTVEYGSVEYQRAVDLDSESVLLFSLYEATDNCDSELTWATSLHIEDRDSDCDHKFRLVRTVSVTDNCGNSADQTTTVNVDDTTDPELSEYASDATAECDSVPLRCHATVIGLDDCDGAQSVLFHEDLSGFNTDSKIGSILRHWTVWDEANNRVNWTQTIAVQDTTPPILSRKPEHMTVECSCELPELADVFALDNCATDGALTDGVSETKADAPQNPSPDNYLLLRTWTAEDGAGLSTTYTQTITVTDFVGPEFANKPQTMELSCSAVKDGWSAMPMEDQTAVDDCGGPVTVTRTESTEEGSCNHRYKKVRTWEAKDRTGNTAVYTQTIHVDDLEAPEVLPVPPLCLPVDENPTIITNVKSLFKVTDNCDPVPSFIHFSCNATGGGDPECTYNEVTDTLSLTPKPSLLETGDTITLHAKVQDDCQNYVNVRQVFWLAADATLAGLSDLTCLTAGTNDAATLGS